MGDDDDDDDDDCGGGSSPPPSPRRSMPHVTVDALLESARQPWMMQAEAAARLHGLPAWPGDVDTLMSQHVAALAKSALSREEDVVVDSSTSAIAWPTLEAVTLALRANDPKTLPSFVARVLEDAHDDAWRVARRVSRVLAGDNDVNAVAATTLCAVLRGEDAATAVEDVVSRGGWRAAPLVACNLKDASSRAAVLAAAARASTNVTNPSLAAEAAEALEAMGRALRDARLGPTPPPPSTGSGDDDDDDARVLRFACEISRHL